MKKTGIMGLVSGELLVFIGGGYWLGDWLDKWLKLAPVFTVVMTVLGLGYAGWRISRLAKDWMK